MRAYKNIRLTDLPDVGDIHNEGRASRVGRLDDRSSFKKPANKATVRRNLKRRDRAATARFDAAAEG